MIIDLYTALKPKTLINVAGKPFLELLIDQALKSGIKKMAIVTPAFVSDCLETLEEIAMEAKEEFYENGGEEFHVVPCLNDDIEWVKVLSRWIDEWAVSKVKQQ